MTTVFMSGPPGSIGLEQVRYNGDLSWASADVFIDPREASMTLTIVITGATSGFGKGVALKLAEGDNSLVLAARRSEELERTAAECGGQALPVPTDVADPEAVARLAEATIARFGHFDVWINNAAVGAFGRFEEIPLADHRRIIETNLLGAINGSHVAIRHFRERGSGTLINIASAAGKVPQAYFSSYCASKAGVLGLSAAIRQELAVNGDRGIKVCTVNPWAADTPFFDHAGNYTGHSLRVPLMQGPDGVIDAIAGLVDSPKDDLEVGVLVKGSVLSSHLAPALAEAVSARMIHKTLYQDAPVSAGDTSGSIHESPPLGNTVDGGMRERIRREDARAG